MAFTPKNDWKTGDSYTAERMIELEATVAANASAAATATTASETASAAAKSVADLRKEVNGKVTSNGGGNKLYGTGASGEDTTYSLGGTIPAENSIAYRTTGGALTVGKPTAVDHATTKKYVDDLIAAQAALITALTDRVAALESPAEG